MPARVRTKRDVVLFAAVALGAPMAASVAMALALRAWAGLDRAAATAFFFTQWMGEALGMVALAPFLLAWAFPAALRWSRGEPGAPRRGDGRWGNLRDNLLQAACLLLGLWLGFVSRAAGQFPLFYFCFLPVMWIALRHGLPGGALGIAVLDLGALVGSGHMRATAGDLADFQVFLLVLSVSGLFVGTVVSQQKATEASLRDSENNFRHLFDAAFDGIVLHQDGIILDANASMSDIFGYDRGQLIGRPLLDLVAPESREPGRAPVRADRPCEAIGRRKDGSEIALELADKEYAYRGQPARVTTIRDISERKRGERDLRESERHLRTVISSSPVVLFAIDPQGCVTLSEGKGLETLGLRPGELVGQSAFTLARRTPLVPDDIRRALAGEATTSVVSLRDLIFETHAQPVGSERSGPGGAIVVSIDITGPKRVEEDLRRSKEHLHTIISHSPIILFALDQAGTFTLSEGAGLESLGLRPGEVVGKSVFDVYAGEPALLANVRRALVGEEFTSLVQACGQFFETHYTPVYQEYDRLAGVIGVAINVSDRKQAEDALRRSEEHLRQAQKMDAIGRVAGGVAHDFNNLLTAITGHADLLAGDPGREAQAARSVDEIKKAAERATSLTRQLLAFSRRQVLSPKLINLNAVVGELDKMLRRLIREDIELVTLLDPSLGQVKADPGQIEQVILNLVINARDAIARAGQITVETRNVELDGAAARTRLSVVPGPYVLLSVSDTGAGMDAEVKAHLFEPFFTTKGPGRGSGLGLSTVYGIVKQSGGNILVESEPGKGTSVRIYLPRTAEEAAKPPQAPAHMPKAKGLETVLLTEDEEAVRTLIREILQMNGYRVLEARHGGEAVLISERHEGPIHLLLTDVVMGNMSGRELALRLRPLRPEMRVLYISGYGEDAIIQHGVLDAGAAFLGKPFTPKTLAQKVREVLDAPVARSPGVASMA